ncbi:MAG: DsbA family protein [Solirubrobacteraceae bacterium]
MADAPATQAIFFYDLGSPSCYLLAEQIMVALPVVVEWEPVLGAGAFAPLGNPDRELIERRADALDLQPVRWPTGWPPDTRTAMLTATYAKRVGRVVAFSLAAFRQCVAGGRDLGEESSVLIAAAACEMHPAAVLKAIGLRSVTQGLEQAGRRALSSGARSLPAITVGGRCFEGPDALEQASDALAREQSW